MRTLPPLTAVRVFEAAARHQNFTKAAAELAMTQAAVSYQIRLLEQRLGLPLFVRDRQRVRLSEAGRRIAPSVSSAFDTLDDAFAGLLVENEHVLAISTTQTFASNWIAPRLGSFQVTRPELAVRLRSEDRSVDFATEDVDVAIRTGERDWPGLRRHFLFNFHSTPMCSPEFLEAHPLGEPRDVFAVPRIGTGDPWWGRWLKRVGLAEPEGRPPGAVWMDSQVTEARAAMAGHGLAMLSPIFWRSELASGRLLAPFPVISLDGFSYWLVYPEYKRNQPKIRAFRDWLLAQVAEDSGLGPPEVFAPPAEAERAQQAARNA